MSENRWCPIIDALLYRFPNNCGFRPPGTPPPPPHFGVSRHGQRQYTLVESGCRETIQYLGGRPGTHAHVPANKKRRYVDFIMSYGSDLPPVYVLPQIARYLLTHTRTHRHTHTCSCSHTLTHTHTHMHVYVCSHTYTQPGSRALGTRPGPMPLSLERRAWQ